MKIALLFLTYRDVAQAALWKSLLVEASDHFNVYIHSKEPLQDPFWARFCLSHTVPTTYLFHVRAWQILLKQALKNPENEKFIFLSESCVPLYPLSLIHRILGQDQHSMMYYHHPWWDRTQGREITEIPLEHRWGSSEWMILNRKHAELVAQDEELIEIMSHHPHDAESYFASLLSLKGVLDEVVYRQTTYASFLESTDTHPYLFTEDNPVNRQRLIHAKMGGCLFARKFSTDFPEEILDTLIHHPLLISSNFEAIPDSLLIKFKNLEQREVLTHVHSCVLLSHLIQDLSLKIGCQVGVFFGQEAERLLQQTTIQELYGIDPYLYDELSGNEQQVLFQQVKQHFLKASTERFVLVREMSKEAAEQVPESHLDFVLINADYLSDPLHVLIADWLPKVREGGIVCGYWSALTRHPDLTSLDLLSEIAEGFQTQDLGIHMDEIEPGFWWVCKES
jgi:hypothetical protein